MYTHVIHKHPQTEDQWLKQVCEQLQMKEQSSSGDKRKERERLVFFSFFTQTRNTQALAAA